MIKALCLTVPWVSLLKCCQPTRSQSVSRHATQPGMCVCVCTFSYINSCCLCVCVRVCACAVFALPEQPPCFNNPGEYILCLLMCVMQPLLTGNSKSSEEAPFPMCTYQLNLLRFPKGWLEMLSEQEWNFCQVSQRLSQKPYFMGTWTIWEKSEATVLKCFQY